MNSCKLQTHFRKYNKKMCLHLFKHHSLNVNLEVTKFKYLLFLIIFVILPQENQDISHQNFLQSHLELVTFIGSLTLMKPLRLSEHCNVPHHFKYFFRSERVYAVIRDSDLSCIKFEHFYTTSSPHDCVLITSVPSYLAGGEIKRLPRCFESSRREEREGKTQERLGKARREGGREVGRKTRQVVVKK